MPKKPQDESPRGPDRALQNVMQGFINELARLDKDALARVRSESELALGERPTYRIADVKVHLQSRAAAREDGLELTAEQLDVSIDFSIRETDGGELIG